MQFSNQAAPKLLIGKNKEPFRGMRFFFIGLFSKVPVVTLLDASDEPQARPTKVTADILKKMVEKLGATMVADDKFDTLCEYACLPPHSYVVLQDEQLTNNFFSRSITGTGAQPNKRFTQSTHGAWQYLNATFITYCYANVELVDPSPYVLSFDQTACVKSRSSTMTHLAQRQRTPAADTDVLSKSVLAKGALSITRATRRQERLSAHHQVLYIF